MYSHFFFRLRAKEISGNLIIPNTPLFAFYAEMKNKKHVINKIKCQGTKKRTELRMENFAFIEVSSKAIKVKVIQTVVGLKTLCIIYLVMILDTAYYFKRLHLTQHEQPVSPWLNLRWQPLSSLVIRQFDYWTSCKQKIQTNYKLFAVFITRWHFCM